MQTRQGKNLFLIWLVLSFLTSMLIVSDTVSAPSTTPTVQAPVLLDQGLVPTSMFSIDVTIADVERLVAFDFYVYYNTSVLTGVGGQGYSPFTYPLPTNINDTEGYIHVGASFPPPEYRGQDVGPEPYPVMRVGFSVDGWGASTLDIRRPVFANTSGAEMPLIVIDGYFANIDPANIPHDIAVTKIEASPARDVVPGELVSIKVTVANQAPFDETFDLTTKVNSNTIIGSESVFLSALTEPIVTFQWDTTGFALGPYVISAEASVVPGEADTGDNIRTADDVVVIGTHDVAVMGIAVSSATVVTGSLVYINATVANLGNFTEAFNVTTKYGYAPPIPPGPPPTETKIETKLVASLAAGASKVLSFAWDTSSVIVRPPTTYVWIAANISETNKPAVLYETKVSNNEFTMPGEVNVWPGFATLDAPVVLIPLKVGQIFSFNITIANVESMVAFDFFLYYNTTVLTAVGNASYSPFTVMKAVSINDTAGYIHLAYNKTFPTTGFKTTSPYPIVRVGFNLTEEGASELNIRDAIVSDVNGDEIPLIVDDGFVAAAPHELYVSLKAPTSAARGDSILLNATVFNLGSSNETNVELQLFINGTVVDFDIIPELQSGTSHTLSFRWNVAVKGVYNITAFVPPILDELSTSNNVATNIIEAEIIVPTASFTYSPELVLEREPVTFLASSSSSEGSSIVSYLWDFGDSNVTEVTAKQINHVYAAKGNYTVTLTVTDGRGESDSTTKTVRIYWRDAAVLSVTPSATEVLVGKSITVSVVVKNRGDYRPINFTVTLYYDSTVIQAKNVTALAMGESKTVGFMWTLTGVTPGTYTMKAEASNTVDSIGVGRGEADTTNNVLASDTKVKVVAHNVAVTGVTLSSNEVFIGDAVTIKATVKNKGNFTETFTVTVYYDNTQIGSKSVSNLAAGASQTIEFSWNTTGVDAATYTLKAVAGTVTDETEKTDNTYLAGTVKVKTPQEPPPPPPWSIPIELLAGAGIAIVVVIAIAVYALRMRKPK